MVKKVIQKGEPPVSLQCVCCSRHFPLHLMEPAKQNKWGVSQTCRNCESANQAALQDRHEQTVKAAIAKLAAKSNKAEPRTVSGEGTYKPEPWTVREGALAYRDIPSKGF